MSSSPQLAWFDATPEALVVLVRDRRQLRLNRAAERLLAGVGRGSLTAQLAAAFAGDRPPATLRRDDGSTLAVTWTLPPADDRDPRADLVLVCRPTHGAMARLDAPSTIGDDRAEPEVAARASDGDGRAERSPRALPDPTALRDAEAALRHSERLLANAERVAGVGGWSLDLRDGSISVTDNWMSIHGLDPGGPRPTTAEECMPLAHQADVPAIRSAFAASLAEGRLYSLEHRIVRRSDGDVRIVKSLGEIERDADGSPIRLHGAALDVTRQRRAEHERERLRSAIEQTSDIVMVTDHRGAIEYVNPAFEHVTGWSSTEAIGRNPRFLATGEHPPDHFRRMWHTLSEGRTWRGRFVNRRRDGSRYVEQASIAPVRDARGAVVQYVAVKRDITADLEREARYEAAQRLEAIGRLAGGVAHDFNNVLMAILGSVEALRDVATEVDHPARGPLANGLDDIETAAGRAADLTRQLLTFARRQTLEREPVDINAVVRGMLTMLERLIPAAIRLEFLAEPEPWPVLADRAQLEQVVANFVLNARDALANGGRIEIRTANRTLPPGESTAGGDFVELSVRDDGPGMTAAAASRVFEPFYTTKASQGGNGLGLATVYGIAQQSGGAVDVVTAPGAGAWFRFRLPRATDPAAIAGRAAPAAAAAGGGERSADLLVVEDEAAIRGTLERALRRAGHRVRSAGSMREALALLDDGFAPDLVVSDVMMPGGTGAELVAALRRRCPGLPVLLISGFAADAFDRDGPPRDPRIGFLPKPFTRTELVARVAGLLG